ncbi:MAG: DUF1570 domain-containing protein [Planctomycetes bacterium]|nr:DUF1570 domain-containing protein [Planctomycetota bacterium]
MMAWLAMFLALTLATPATGVTGVEESTRTEKSELQRRLKLIASHDEASIMQLAEWAERKHLFADADKLYRDIIDRNPQHDSARRKLDHLAARRQLLVDSEAFLATHRLLPPRFLRYETKRFIVLSDASPSWTRIQTSRLKRTHHQFMRFAKRLGLAPLPLKHKLVCVLFKERSAYLDFARTRDNASASWIAGYYAPGADRVVFYNVEHSEGISEARQKLNDMQKEIKLLRQNISRSQRQGSRRQSANLRENIGRYQKHFEQETSRIDRFASSLSAATTVHESIHQLFFHTGIQSPKVEYPLWISEGIATAFETGDINLPFGPDRDYDQRREEFLRMLQNHELFNLTQLVSMVEITSGDEDVVRRVYHQSYALVTWLCRFRAEGMREYLNLMRLEHHGESTPERHIQIFTNAFGDLTRLERAWIRHEQQLLRKSRLITRGRNS